MSQEVFIVVVSLVGLIFAGFLAFKIKKAETGPEEAQKISAYIYGYEFRHLARVTPRSGAGFPRFKIFFSFSHSYPA